jgi:hypothetical protein
MMDAKQSAEKEHIGMLTELQGRIERITHIGEMSGFAGAGVKATGLR